MSQSPGRAKKNPRSGRRTRPFRPRTRISYLPGLYIVRGRRGCIPPGVLAWRAGRCNQKRKGFGSKLREASNGHGRYASAGWPFDALRANGSGLVAHQPFVVSLSNHGRGPVGLPAGPKRTGGVQCEARPEYSPGALRDSSFRQEGLRGWVTPGPFRLRARGTLSPFPHHGIPDYWDPARSESIGISPRRVARRKA